MEIVHRLYTTILDLVFPKRCLGCFVEGAWLCTACCLRLPQQFFPECFFCHRPSPDGRLCFSCAKGNALTGVLVGGVYADAFLREAIQELKFHGVRDLVSPLGASLCSVLQSFFHAVSRQDRSSFLVVPVPLAARRFRERGFNQSELLARVIANNLSLLCVSALERVQFSEPQTALSHEERHRAVHQSFVFSHKGDCVGKTIFLVDDVITTGATLDECARILKRGGAKEVWGVALASG